MAGEGPRVGQPADTRLVLTSDTGFAIQLYSMLKCEIWASPISLMGGGGPRGQEDILGLDRVWIIGFLTPNHLLCVIQLYLFSVLEFKNNNRSPLKLKCVGLKLVELCIE